MCKVSEWKNSWEQLIENGSGHPSSYGQHGQAACHQSRLCARWTRHQMSSPMPSPLSQRQNIKASQMSRRRRRTNGCWRRRPTKRTRAPSHLLSHLSSSRPEERLQNAA